MPKIATPLKALEVKRLNKPGLHAVGTVSGLCLSISNTGTKSWILRTKVGSSRKEIGLGPYPEIPLALAHERARKAKESVRVGIDPVEEKKASKLHIEWNFEKCAKEYIELHTPSWRNEKHSIQWTNTLKTYAFPIIGRKNVNDISCDDVIAVIKPYWFEKTETMRRVLNRIEIVLNWSKAKGILKGVNPATWKNNISLILPKPSKIKVVKPHKALPFNQIQKFMTDLKAVNSMSARCLEFQILTAARPIEARKAKWSEIDFVKRERRIAGNNMKGGRDHRVPLSNSSIELLSKMPRIEGVDYIFFSGEKCLSDMALTQLTRRMKVSAVPHGFRSTFTDWCSESTNHSRDARELALAHKIDNRTEEAYRRGDMFEKRLELMKDWDNFINNFKSENVIQIQNYKK
jgi:integrase